ncbi:MAG: hypothetical protein M3N50_14645 [Pseudomonadota bacterium]|nr:hypothetical protein [Pseudomonadota bacterium]
MNDQFQESFDERSRKLFHDSVEGLDMRIRSRLTQARHAAIDAAATGARHWLFRHDIWQSTAGITAAAVLGAALWFGSPLGHHGMTVADTQSNLEDLEIVAASDEGSGDALEMLQDDIDFYDFADKAGSDTAAKG